MRTPAVPAPSDRLVAYWERVRESAWLKGTLLFAIVMLLTAAGAVVPNPRESLLAEAERLGFDAQMRFLRSHFPLPVANDVVLIGTDEETEKAFKEPIALWHRHFAETFRALAKAGPLVVGVDFGLPERSFDAIIPGIDRSMMIGLVALKSKTKLVYVQNVNAVGEAVPVQENYRNIVTPENLGIDQALKDPDGTARRFSERELGVGGPVPTLAGQMLRSIGRPVGEGYIDFSVGHPVVRHVPMQDVVAWHQAGDDARLQATFGGRIVLIGGLTLDRDRWNLPVKLIELPEESRRAPELGEAARKIRLSQPGVVIHLQVLRSHLANGLLSATPEWLRWLLCTLAALAVFLRARPWLILLAAAGIPLALVAVDLFLIRSAQLLLPVASIVFCFWLALIVRGIFDGAEAVVERVRLQRSFAGQVSPAVMNEMLSGGLTPGVSGQLADVCVLFSDIRGFTTLSEKMPPEIVTLVLQRYFDRMVRAVHRFDGTVDKFIGDGMMVLFGAPKASKDPCGEAVQCALAMMSELDDLNREFEREGLPTLTIGIGVNYGSVTLGNIGSSERHNYSAIGDAVNVAARLESLTKEIGRKIVVTEAVVSRVEGRFQFDPLGEHQLKGHSPVNVWGIRTARTAPAAA